MYLVIDIGNSTVVCALAEDDGSIVTTWRFKTAKDAAAAYFVKNISEGLSQVAAGRTEFRHVLVSSVVPELDAILSAAVEEVCGELPYFFTHADASDIMPLDVESPQKVGNDRVADALGVVACYKLPAIVFDMGTATTVGVIDASGVFKGGMIIPGVKTSLNALSRRASQLPVINVEKPCELIGRNTLESMQSGVVYGTAAMLDGLVSRISGIIGQPATVVATGGMAQSIVPYCVHDIIYDRHLQFKGILHAALNREKRENEKREKRNGRMI